MNFAILTKTDATKLLLSIKGRDKSKNQEKITQNPGHFLVSMSFDLGNTTEQVEILDDRAIIRGEVVLAGELEKLKEDTFYTIVNGELKSIDFFGENTKLVYKLKPTKDWPTLTLSSVPMHRFKTVSPKTSAQLMTGEILPIRGKVLDTCCGLGYTSILSAQKETCDEAVVFEIDENVLRIAEYNPYSKELFTNKKIKLHQESVFSGIKKLQSNYFDKILHDPPTISFAKELYSDEFYRELFRVIKKGGILYHYCPNPGKTKGTHYYPTLIKMLSRNGFSECKYNPKSSGVTAKKK